MNAEQMMGIDGRGVPRMLEDLAEGRLSEAEAGTVVDWLTAARRGAPVGREPRRANRPPVIGAPRAAPDPMAQARRGPGPRHSPAAMPDRGRVRRPRARAPDVRGRWGGDRPRAPRQRASRPGPPARAGRREHARPSAASGVGADGPLGRQEVAVDALGQFALDGLAHGPHRLEVRLVYELIEIPDLRLWDRPTLGRAKAQPACAGIRLPGRAGPVLHRADLHGHQPLGKTRSWCPANDRFGTAYQDGWRIALVGVIATAPPPEVTHFMRLVGGSARDLAELLSPTTQACPDRGIRDRGCGRSRRWRTARLSLA